MTAFSHSRASRIRSNSRTGRLDRSTFIIRSISVRDLERFHHKVHRALDDPRVIYEFLSLFQNH